MDLRTQRCQNVIDRVERCLGVRLNREAAVVSGVRWERVPTETPERYQGLSWLTPERCVLWRTDEIELVTALPIKPGGVLGVDPGLALKWWATLGRSLGALAAQLMTRVATPHTVPISQERVTSTIERVFPGRVVTIVTEWAVAHADLAHADLAWANLTAPECWLLDCLAQPHRIQAVLEHSGHDRVGLGEPVNPRRGSVLARALSADSAESHPSASPATWPTRRLRRRDLA